MADIEANFIASDAWQEQSIQLTYHNLDKPDFMQKWGDSVLPVLEVR